MRPRTLSISAGSDAEALRKAEKKFDIEPANILLKNNGDGNYTATRAHCDAEVDVVISEDKLFAFISHGLPATGNGKPFTYDRLIQELAEFDVHTPPLSEAVKIVLEDLGAGEEVHDVLIAKGVKPKPSIDASVEPLGDWSFPALPGDAIGKIIPAQDAVPGRYVNGERKMPEGNPKGKGIKFAEDSGCFIDKTAFVIRSERYGIVTLHKQDMYVSELVNISKDAMRVTTTLFPKDFRGAQITEARLQETLEHYYNLGIKIDGYAFATAIAKADQTGGALKNVTLCQGQAPKHGKNGWFEMIFKDERPKFGIESEDGVMDYRARGVVRSVTKGEHLGLLHPPEPGLPGKDVFGRVIPALEGIALNIVAGENVTNEKDSPNYYASEPGMVFFMHNSLSVSDVYRTEGDVNMSTGNIVVEKGSVHVTGSVLSGFSIASPRNILINGIVESATLEADGDIEIRGGIMMDKSGKLTAKGGISALYAQNATIVSHGDVNIAHEITNSVVFARNHVIATKGRGKIIGSTVRCGKGLEAKEIGNNLGVETTIFLGLDRKPMTEEITKRKELEAVVQKILGALGAGDPRDILARAQPEKRPAIASLLKARIRAEKQIKEIENNFERERQALKKLMTAKIKVHKTVFPGTIINCFGTSLKISEPITFSQIYYDSTQEKIVVASM